LLGGSSGAACAGRADSAGLIRAIRASYPLGYPLSVGAFHAESRLRLRVISKHDIDRFRARAAHYRREAARAKTRSRLIYCRALADHLDREALELERVFKSNSPGALELVSVARARPRCA